MYQLTIEINVFLMYSLIRLLYDVIIMDKILGLRDTKEPELLNFNEI